ncbi:uncharacterized protein LOC135200863 isoform X5 [Macrobrachium nipponense]|uniref:uncharacterized protein LOC135200863 isoform X5 n=1 Tax=Macrobrachium nipponense TaxID=159736 RepID=UPI0030C869B2
MKVQQVNYVGVTSQRIANTRDTRIPKLFNKMLRQLAVISCICIAVTIVYSAPSQPALHRSKRWEEFPNVTFTFDCTNRPVGFYADQEFNCQLFHMCDEDGRRIPYMCANDTAFNQEYRICDWQYNFDCSAAQNWFYLNELTYVTDPPKF